MAWGWVDQFLFEKPFLDPLYEGIGKKIEAAVIKFMRKKKPSDYKLSIELTSDENPAQMLHCR